MEPLYQAIRLWMERCGWRVNDSKELAEISPDRACELCSMIGGDHRQNSKVWIQDRSKALAHFSAVVDWRGITFGHPLVLSTMVNKKVCPQD